MSPKPIPKQPGIVCVTDCPETAKFVAEFKKEGFDVTVVREGKKALNIANYKGKHWVPTMFLIDLVLPQMSGFELTRRVMDRYPNGKVPVILMSTHVEAIDVLEAKQAGALTLVQKPVTWDTIKTALRKRHTGA